MGSYAPRGPTSVLHARELAVLRRTVGGPGAQEPGSWPLGWSHSMALGRGFGHKVQPAGMNMLPLRSGTPQSPTRGTVTLQVPHRPPDSCLGPDLVSHGQAPSCHQTSCSHGSSLTQGRPLWFKALCPGYSRPPQTLRAEGLRRVWFC